MVIEKGLPERTLLNVNVPPGTPIGVAVTVQGRREHEGTIFEGLDPRRRTYYWIEEGRDRWVNDDMSDIHAVQQGLISVTPLHTDTTHHAVLAALRGWEKALHGTSPPPGPEPQRSPWLVVVLVFSVLLPWCLPSPGPRNPVVDSSVLPIGAWLSLVERLVRDQEAGGSNPLAPTIRIKELW